LLLVISLLLPKCFRLNRSYKIKRYKSVSQKKLDGLLASVQEQAAKAYELWRSDPYHNSLQFKRVSQRQPIYSARVSLNYRVLGLLEDDHLVC
jgi:hypothetical protein